jgi:hypothetical protein
MPARASVSVSASTDLELLAEIFGLADEVSAICRDVSRLDSVTVRLDRLLAIAGERWAPGAFAAIEAAERAELIA